MLREETYLGSAEGASAYIDVTNAGRKLVQELQEILATRQLLVVGLRSASDRGDAAAVDLAEGLAHLTKRHDAVLEQLARTIPPAGTPYRLKVRAA